MPNDNPYSGTNFLDSIFESPVEKERIIKKIAEVKQNKASLLTKANEYQQKYADEIEKGTLQRALLLEDGKRKGLKEEDIFKGNEIFIPTKETPILNFLYFMLRDSGEYGDGVTILRENKDLDKDFKELEKEYNDKYGQEVHEKVADDNLKDSKEFLYGNVGMEEFATLKKLKRLSKSDNENEAFLAYSKAMKLCKELGLDFDKIPS